MLPMTPIDGRWALITGASRGIGYLTAQFLAKQGCNLILHSRSLAHTEDVLKEVQLYGISAYAVEAELSDHKQIVEMLNKIELKGTQVDIVCNNAAVQVPYQQDFWQTPIDDFALSFQVNLTAIATICYRLIPPMIERGYGRVINTTSGIRHQPEQAAYSASKAALDKFTVDLGTKLEGTNVTINLTDPGWCRTDLGGPKAPNAPEDALPGVCIAAFLNDGRSGRLFNASDYTGLMLEDAIAKASV